MTFLTTAITSCWAHPRKRCSLLTTCALLQQVYQTQYDVVIMQGDAILALEAAALSLIAPGDKVLNLVSGVFGKGYESFIKRAWLMV